MPWTNFDRTDGVPGGINLPWLLRLRFIASCGHMLIIGATQWLLGVRLPLVALCGLVAVTVVTNIGAALFSRRRPAAAPSVPGPLMVLDVLVLTAMLYVTGGASNPFSLLYLVNIVLATVMLPTAWSASLAALSAACFAALFFVHVPLDGIGAPLSPVDSRHLRGILLAFAVSALFIVYFVTRVRAALARRERELEAARQVAERGQRLAALATLAGGAAHELSTPLSTIAIAAKELSHAIGLASSSIADADLREELSDDAKLIREQVDRCRSILTRMSRDAGRTSADSIKPVRVDALVDNVIAEHAARVERHVDEKLGAVTLRLPLASLAPALHNIVDNAVRASSAEKTVTVSASRGDDETLRIDVVDEGVGMDAEALERVGEPFFTTREVGDGMGLGVFVARSMVEDLGGRLDVDSTVGHGTKVRVVIPFAATAPISAASETT